MTEKVPFNKFSQQVQFKIGYIQSQEYIDLIDQAIKITQQQKTIQEQKAENQFKIPNVIIETKINDEQKALQYLTLVNQIDKLRKQLPNETDQQKKNEKQQQIQTLQNDINNMNYNQDDIEKITNFYNVQQINCQLKDGEFQNELANLTVNQQITYTPEQIQEIKQFQIYDNQQNLEICQRRNKKKLILQTENLLNFQQTKSNGYLDEWNLRYNHNSKNTSYVYISE